MVMREYDEPRFPTIDEARERLTRRLALRRSQSISRSSIQLADELDYAADARDNGYASDNKPGI
jgi:pullulanase/glycogen debranching enzyme